MSSLPSCAPAPFCSAWEPNHWRMETPETFPRHSRKPCETAGSGTGESRVASGWYRKSSSRPYPAKPPTRGTMRRRRGPIETRYHRKQPKQPGREPRHRFPGPAWRGVRSQVSMDLMNGDFDRSETVGCLGRDGVTVESLGGASPVHILPCCRRLRWREGAQQRASTAVPTVKLRASRAGVDHGRYNG